MRFLADNSEQTSIRYSESFDTPLPDLIGTVGQHQLEGIVANRAGSPYRSGERSGDSLKWRANQGQEFVIGGYIPNHYAVGFNPGGVLSGRRAQVRWPGSGRPDRGVAPHAACIFRRAANKAVPVQQPPRTQWATGETVLQPQKWICAAGSIPFWSPSLSFWNGFRTVDCGTRGSPEFAATRTLARSRVRVLLRPRYAPVRG